MKQPYILIFFISLFIVGGNFNTISAQNKKSPSPKNKVNDSLKYKLKYGLRIGTDISKIIRSSFDDDYKGLEIIGDFRVTKNWYAAAEIGTEEKITKTDNLEIFTSGSYFKAGADYNFFDNWFGMENMIYSGFRIGASTFSHERKGFSIYNTNQYWTSNLDQFDNTTPEKFNDLSLIWLEFMMGLKAELFNNLYMGVAVQLKRQVFQNELDNFENLYAPGFNRTYGNSKFGVGYSYNISYLIPLYRKAARKKKTKETEKNKD